MSLVTFAALFVLMALDGSRVAVPWFGAAIEAYTGAESQDISVGEVEFALGQGDVPAGLLLNDVTVSDGEMIVTLPRVETEFTMLDGIRGLVRPKTIEVTGTQLNFVRDRNNQIALLSPDGEALVLLGANDQAQTAGLGDWLGDLEQLRDLAVLEELEVVDLTGITVAFIDQRSGRRWISRDATAELRKDDGLFVAKLDASLDSSFLAQVDPVPMQVSVQLTTNLTTSETEVLAKFTDVPPADLASQIELFDWMDLVDGRVSGNLALHYGADAGLTRLSGVLELGPGQIEPEQGQKIGFDGAKGYFSYDPANNQIRLDGLSVETVFGGFSAEGTVTPKRDQGDAISALVAQLSVADLTLTAPEYLAKPVEFTAGDLTARVSFSPFRIDIGQAQLFSGDTRLSLTGRVKPGVSSWDVAMDASINEIEIGGALALWPETFRPNLRTWLGNHLHAGSLTNLSAHLRTPGGSAAQLGLDFAFSDGRASVLNTLPPIEGGSGNATLIGDRFSLVLNDGHADIAGQRIELAGSSFVIPDTTIDKGPAVASVRGYGPIEAQLKLIDLEPLGLLSRLGRTPDLASGIAIVEAELNFDLRKDLRARDVEAEVLANLIEVQSDTLIDGRELRADRLVLRANNDGMHLRGDVTLSDVPIQMTYRREFADEAPPGQIEGAVAVTQANLNGLGINLPEGMLGGSGQARFTVSLPANETPRYSVTAGLGGNALSLPELNWTKPTGPPARVALSGRLGGKTTVDSIDFSGPGLAARGRLDLGQAGLERAEFSRLAIGGWLDAPLIWEPGRKRAIVRGGTVDLRGGPNFSAGRQGGVELALAPDRVVVSNGIVLTRFHGDITTKGGTRGRFTARVNDRAIVQGVIQDGSKIFIEGRDGGAVLRDAGLFGNARGGTLRVSLTPIANGSFDGRFSLQKTRVTDAPVLAEMLSIISVFGLIERLGGEGIAFEDVQGWFALSGDRLVISRSRAVGPSMGVTLAGTYNLRTDRLDMDGVLSPLYFVNGLPARIAGLGRLFGGRDGEGLLGASFRVGGTASAPKASVNPLSMLTPGLTREIFNTRSTLRPSGN